MGRSRKRTNGEQRADRPPFNKYALYQLAVQEPAADIEFIDETFAARFERTPHTLREDFCAAAYVACEWVKHDDANRAWGVDRDPEPLAWGLANNAEGFDPSQSERRTVIEGDVLDVRHDPVDVIAAFNFSYYCLHTRRELLRYFTAAYRNLGPEGLFVLDIYGGPEAQALVEETTEHADFNYVWDQDEFDPIQSRMVCYIHFEKPAGKKRMKRAFTYDWRLWTILEVREALSEVGFAATEIYWEGVEEKTGEGDGVFTLEENAENTESWIAYIVGIKL